MITTFKILLVEWDKDVASITKNFLISRGYSIVICFDGEEALQHFRRERFDFVLVDVNVPIINGFDLIKEIKSRNKDVPVVCLGNDKRQSEIAKGFKSGADDFLTRPFSMEELAFRIEAVSSRFKDKERLQYKYTFGAYTFDSLHHRVLINGKDLHLSDKEAELLYLLYEFKNRVVERAYALQKIWRKENYFNARNMDVYVGHLRKILCYDPQVYIENVHGIGYRLVVPQL